MSYLSNNEGNTYVGKGTPTPTTNLPTAFVGRLYLDTDSGITYRLRDDTVNANIWQSMEMPSQIISLAEVPIFTDNVPDKSLWNDTHIFDAPTNNWLVIKSDDVPTQDMDNSKGYDEGHEIVTPVGTFKLVDGKKDKAIWAREDEQEPTTSTPCSETGYIIVGKTLFKCYGDGNWYNYDTNTLVTADDPTTITPLPCDIKVQYGNEEFKTQNINGECKLKVTVSDRVPTAGDDVADGYLAGDIWNVSTTGDSYEAIDTTEGKAKWALLRDRDPINTDDIDYGFEVGDYWKNYTTGAVFVNADNTDDKAVWFNISDKSPKDVEFDRDPTKDDDESIGYNPNDHWKNNSTGEEFLARDTTDGAAVWIYTKKNSKPDSSLDKTKGYRNGDEIQVGDVTYTLADADNGTWIASAYRDPTKDDDENSSPSWNKGDKWLNKATNESFVCFDNADGNAVWLSDKDKNEVSTDRDPTKDDDISFNFKPDDVWKNNSSGEEFLAVDTTDGNAVWIKTKSNTKPDSSMNTDAGYPIGHQIEVGSNTYEQLSDGVWAILKTTDPTRDDDEDNFDVGDVWKNTKTGIIFTNFDDTNHNAIWTTLQKKNEIYNENSPTNNNDETQQFKVDDKWYKDDGSEFILRNAEAGSPDWIALKGISKPTTDMDSAHGYEGGDKYEVVDSSGNTIATYILIDAGAGEWARYEGRNPTADDDENSNPPCDVGEYWINSNSQKKFICDDNSDGSAVWTPTVKDTLWIYPKSSDPSTMDDGGPLLTGATYYNTSDKVTKYYNGSDWVVLANYDDIISKIECKTKDGVPVASDFVDNIKLIVDISDSGEGKCYKLSSGSVVEVGG